MYKQFIFIIILIFPIYSQFIHTVQTKVVNYAKEKEGSEEWEYSESGIFFLKFFDKGKDRLAENGKTFFCDYEPKCNLFVYEMLYKGGLELPLINEMPRNCKQYHENEPQGRPPTNKDLVEGKISELYLVGTNQEGINKAIPGDIISNGGHMGIVIGNDETISASTKSIRKSDFNGYGDSIYIFRYDNGVPIFSYSVKTKNNGIQKMRTSETADYAGIIGDPIIGIAIKVDRCSVKYRVHIKGGKWLGYVNGYDWNDYDNGYAGNGKEIDLVEVNFIYCDLNPKTDMRNVPYRVSPLNKDFYSYQHGNIKGANMDGYAGAKGKSIDRFQISTT